MTKLIYHVQKKRVWGEIQAPSLSGIFYRHWPAPYHTMHQQTETDHQFEFAFIEAIALNRFT